MTKTHGNPCRLSYLDISRIVASTFVNKQINDSGQFKSSFFQIIRWPKVYDFGHWVLEFICYLMLAIWNLIIDFIINSGREISLKSKIILALIK